MGGLGNQLFQYAAAKRIAVVNNSPLKLDIAEYQENSSRQFQLNNFNIIAGIASPENLSYFYRYRGLNLKAISLNFIQNFLPYSKRIYIKEPSFEFNPRVLTVSKNAYLEGYWQSERYFKDIEDIIRQEFTLKKPLLSSKNPRIALEMKNYPSVSVHIRRKDYLTPKLSKIFHVCPSEYYYSAIDSIKKRLKNPVFFVFADDINWAKESLAKFPEKIVFVSDQNINKDYEELHLMSQCKHNIIANSSFSWWGAWLNKNPEKIVIAPKNWFKDNSKNTKDLIPEGWIKL